MDPDGPRYFQQDYHEPRRNQLRPLVERAISRGLLHPGLDPELAMDILFGPAVFRALRQPGPVGIGQLRTIITLALNGLLSREGAPRHDGTY